MGIQHLDRRSRPSYLETLHILEANSGRTQLLMFRQTILYYSRHFVRFTILFVSNLDVNDRNGARVQFDIIDIIEYMAGVL